LIGGLHEARVDFCQFGNRGLATVR
jgi:hypothetical protein